MGTIETIKLYGPQSYTDDNSLDSLIRAKLKSDFGLDAPNDLINPAKCSCGRCFNEPQNKHALHYFICKMAVIKNKPELQHLHLEVLSDKICESLRSDGTERILPPSATQQKVEVKNTVETKSQEAAETPEAEE